MVGTNFAKIEHSHSSLLNANVIIVRFRPYLEHTPYSRERTRVSFVYCNKLWAGKRRYPYV